MACCQPFSIDNPHYNKPGYFQWWKKYIEVPCGWCLNCRLDRQNWLTDAMEYEQRKYNYVCSFVTFTYDDIYIQELSNITADDFYYYNGQYLPYDSDKELVYSLRRSDAQLFLKRLRRKINYLYEKHNIKNVDLCRKDFKYCVSGEYGDKFGRPHFHFIFFGLDWQFCKELFESCWHKGIIESDPVNSGAFEYLTKYLIKQTKGEQAKRMYDDKGIERPFFTHSLGLGKGIILEQFDYIREHNLCYKTLNDTLRPIPIYYRNFYFHYRPKLDYTQTNENMFQAGISPIRDCDFAYKSPVYRYSFKQMNDFRRQQALLRHQQLEKNCENSGIPISPLNDYQLSSFRFKNIDLKNIIEIAKYGDVVPF